MEVCDVCCNYMANTDSEIRKAEHLAGKQHKGWEAIREHLTMLRAMNDNRGPPRRKRDLKDMIAELTGGAKPDDKSSNKDRDRDRDRDRERDDRRDRDRDKYDRGHRDYRDRGRDDY